MLHFSNALRQSPNNKAYALGYAKASFKAGVRDSAIATFQKVLTDDPRCGQCWHEYAMTYYLGGERDAAVKVWQQAVASTPESAEMEFGLAGLLDRYGMEGDYPARLNEAALHYRKSLELRPRKGSIAVGADADILLDDFSLDAVSPLHRDAFRRGLDRLC